MHTGDVRVYLSHIGNRYFKTNLDPDHDQNFIVAYTFGKDFIKNMFITLWVFLVTILNPHHDPDHHHNNI